MPKITIDSETALKLANSDSHDLYEEVHTEIIDEWRWGNVYELVVRNKQDNTLWSFTYKEHSGDHYHNSLEDEEEVELVQMQATQVVKTIFTPVPDTDTDS